MTSEMKILVDKVANELMSGMADQDCEDFEEFVDINDWSSKDIKEEFYYMIVRMFGGSMTDDYTLVFSSCDDDYGISYREFKKAVLDKIKADYKYVPVESKRMIKSRRVFESEETGYDEFLDIIIQTVFFLNHAKEKSMLFMRQARYLFIKKAIL